MEQNDLSLSRPSTLHYSSEIHPYVSEFLYTCYKEVGQKVPKNLYQSIIDTKKNKGWIESSDMGNIFVSVIGENYVEHDMKK
ncbi:hypothetical protein [Bacteroides uniformis]|uniref:hypothetical protein n=1 Tax=Bacteroides uniformis TaxID=820 RepID=UPI0039B6DCF7